MNLAQPKQAYIHEEEYVYGEEFSTSRHEYLDGRVYAMAGASDKHNRIALNAAILLDAHLPDGGEVFASPLKLTREHLPSPHRRPATAI